MTKNVLYLTQYYLTEQEGGGQRHFKHVNALVEAGYNVSVVTCYVDYIKRTIPQEYQGKKIVKEIVNDKLTVYKTYAYPGYGKDVFSRLRNMSSYSYQAYNAAKKIKNIDLIIASSPPLTLGLTAISLAKSKKCNFIFEVRDLWPDTPVEMGTLNNKFLINAGKYIEKESYKQAKNIIGLTQGMCERIIAKGVDSNKVHFVSNGADVDVFKQITTQKPLGLVRKSESEFIITYAGVHSSYPDLQNVLKSAELLKNYPDIKFVFVGDGDNKPELLRMKEEMQLNNAIFFDRQPKSEIPNILASSDMCIVSYQPLEFWRHAFPNKTFDYMASSRPILASVLEGEITDLVKRADCGVCIEPGNPQILADKVLNLYQNKQDLGQMGLNGRNYVEEHYNRSKIIEKYLEIVEKSI